MCLVLTKSAELQTATEDIIVYKMLVKTTFGNHRTPYQNSLVKIGKTYKSKLVREEIETNPQTSFFNVPEISYVEKGLHSYVSANSILRIAKLSERFVAAKCIIPKGSKYYKGLFSDDPSYASDQLTYVEFLNR